jgi:hypothetical protein
VKKVTKVPPLTTGLQVSVPVDLARKVGVCGAMLVAQIHFLCHVKVNERQGYRWTYQTYPQWAEMLPFKPTTIRHALTYLEEVGLVISGNFNGNLRDRTKWYRVNYHHELLNSDSRHVPDLDSHNEEFGHMAVSDLDDSYRTEISTENTTEKSVVNTTHSPKGLGAVMKIIKNTGGVKVSVKKPTTSDSVLAGLQIKNGAPPPPKNAKQAMVAIWRTVPKFNPEVGMIPVLTVIAQSQLADIAKKLGPTAESVLSHVVSHWIAYTKFVESAKAVKKTPNTPDVGFVLKYVTEAGSFWKLSVQSTAKSKASATLPPPVTTKPVAAALIPPTHKDEEEPEASLDDVLAWSSKLK